MEALAARRICSLCLGQLFKSRHCIYQRHTVKTFTGSIRKNSFRSYSIKNTNAEHSGGSQNQSPLWEGGKNALTGLTSRMGGKKFPWTTVAIITGFGAVYGMIRYLKSDAEKALLEKQAVPMVTLSVGGDWELMNQDGQIMTNKDFKGQWVLLYFGFTHCPDICPDELEKIVKAVNVIDKNKELPNIQPLFVTVDEDRDSIDVIKAYLEEFSPKLIGFTGTKEQVNSVRKAYRVYSSKGPVDADNDYIVDHSIITYLINPDGDTVMYFSRDKTMLDVARAIEKAMMLYNKLRS